MRRTRSIPTVSLLLLASVASGSSLATGATAASAAPGGPPPAAVTAPVAEPAGPLTVTVGEALVRAAGPTRRIGDRGQAVSDLQWRLLTLGFWLDGVDGVFGANTQHAVVALQKYWGLGRDGVVGPQTWAVIDRNERARPYTTSGRLVEVDPRRQITFIADSGTAWVLDSSTGAVAGTTPSGFYHVFRHVNGNDPGPNGTLYRPKYFVGGVAVHGYPSVPPYPASHGCVRVTMAAMDLIWWWNLMPIGSLVWVY